MTKKIDDPWHYPREQLAKSFLATFDIGLESARGIFAKRRMGKTEFLKKDLIPAAEKAGYLTAYANLWDDNKNPGKVLISAIAEAVQPKGLSKILEKLKTPIKKVKASAKLLGVAEGGIEAELKDDDSLQSTLLLEVLKAFDKQNKKLILAIDEAQALATKEHSDFAHALRSALDTRKISIKVIFAGSSENTLRRMFARATEPFYNWAPLRPFDLLGVDFVKDMTMKVNDLSRHPLTLKESMLAFEELHRTPDFFRRFLTRYLTHAQLGAPAALDATKSEVFNDKEFVNYWSTLLPADQEILKMLAVGESDLHSKISRTTLGAALGLAAMTSLSTPQQAIKRLQADAVLTRLSHGEYAFEDDAFAQWVRGLET
jgi:hypothetical protein